MSSNKNSSHIEIKNPKKRKTKINNINEITYKQKEKQEFSKLTKDTIDGPLKNKNNNLKDYMKDFDHIAVDTRKRNEIKENKENFVDLELIKSNSNFKAALEIFNTMNPSGTKKMEIIPRPNKYFSWKFTDFCKNFCSKYQDTSKNHSSPNGVCIDLISKNTEIVKNITLKAERINTEKGLYQLLTSTIKTEKLTTDRTSCLFNSLQNQPNEEPFLSPEMKYLVFKEIFL